MIWNSLNTGDYEGMIAETISITGYQGDTIRAYYSRPLGAGPYPGIVLIPHMPGWDEFLRETARRFTQHGYSVLCPDIYGRFGTGTPTEVSQKMREAGGVSDDSVMGDCDGALRFLRNQTQSNGKTGVIGMCSGGRHTFLAACTLEHVDAAVDCWGGAVVMEPQELTETRPVSPSDYAANLSCPLLGIFGNDDKRPDTAEVDKLEEILKDLGKDYEFYRYDGAGHGIWYYDKPLYRQEQAMDSWEKTLEFFDRNLKE
ncbi:MAG: dienelactone hydrolase family protein [Lachnospiraceae bacterium]|nr:dienelactone hydrolase family protein [Lachnospiraceae bacterium]MCD7842904.1 dienelactone hydrolase family protein [Lachnospiraceae bacterium]